MSIFKRGKHAKAQDLSEGGYTVELSAESIQSIADAVEPHLIKPDVTSEKTPEELERTGGLAFKAWADDNWVKTEWNEKIDRFVRVEPDYHPDEVAFPSGFNAQEFVDGTEEPLSFYQVAGDKPVAPFEVELDLVLGEIRALLLEKNASYGDSALNPVRIMSDADAIEQLKVRIDDKFSRMYRGFAYEDTETGSPEDTLKDIVGYYFLLKIAEARNAQS